MGKIKKIKLFNFKKFQTFTCEVSQDLNILVGDNESGKSSIIEAINIVLSGSRNKIENYGLDNLFNVDAINAFAASDKNYKSLPSMSIELYFHDTGNEDLNGQNNSDNVICDGLKLECIPNDELGREIIEILKQKEFIFPFEYYTIRFSTFQGDAYSGYKRFLKHILIDNSLISSEYAIKEFVKDMYNNYTSPVVKNKHQFEYRKQKEVFKSENLRSLNDSIDVYDFAIKNSIKANLDTDLTLSENNVMIDNKGKGIQCFIKTEFALAKKTDALDVVLLEEPENHLSHINMKKLINRINTTTGVQLFISTHSNMLSTRLNLKKSILLNSGSTTPILLSMISESTAKFFIKAPDNNILDMILSKKNILVEGDAEFILMEAFFHLTSGQNINEVGVNIISVDGTSFKRYLEIAKKLAIKTAVIRDNDGDYQKNCVDNYSEYTDSEFIKIFSAEDPKDYTFEVCTYRVNTSLCDELFSTRVQSRFAQDYMLKHKSETALNLLESIEKSKPFIVPDYIKNAIQWISE
ncbi:MAG: ATP-dependent nuclease [Bacteroidota bacterium]